MEVMGMGGGQEEKVRGIWEKGERGMSQESYPAIQGGGSRGGNKGVVKAESVGVWDTEQGVDVWGRECDESGKKSMQWSVDR